MRRRPVRDRLVCVRATETAAAYQNAEQAFLRYLVKPFDCAWKDGIVAIEAGKANVQFGLARLVDTAF